jgi:hypothetical protein
MVESLRFRPPSSRGPGRGPLKAKTGVRVPLGAPDKSHLEPCSMPVEQFLAMLRFEKREKLAELPGKILESGRDEFV